MLCICIFVLLQFLNDASGLDNTYLKVTGKCNHSDENVSFIVRTDGTEPVNNTLLVTVSDVHSDLLYFQGNYQKTEVDVYIGGAQRPQTTLTLKHAYFKYLSVIGIQMENNAIEVKLNYITCKEGHFPTESTQPECGTSDSVCGTVCIGASCNACGQCVLGYDKNDISDKNSCNVNVDHPKNSVWINKGVYACIADYYPSIENKHNCATATCSQNCKGQFCTVCGDCLPGYELNKVDASCVPIPCSTKLCSKKNEECKRNDNEPYKCVCKNGHVRISNGECASVDCNGIMPCKNGGVCRNNKCDCEQGWKGELCDEEVQDMCTQFKVKNITFCSNGDCMMNNQSQPVCQCSDGNHGEFCQYEIGFASPKMTVWKAKAEHSTAVAYIMAFFASVFLVIIVILMVKFIQLKKSTQKAGVEMTSTT